MSGLLRAFCASEQRKWSVTICRMTVWFHAKRLFYRFAAPDGNCKTCRLGPADSLRLGAGVCWVIGPSLARSQAGARRCPRPGSWACLRLTGVSHVPKREQSRLSRARSPHKGGSRKCVTFPPARDRRDPWRRSPGGGERVRPGWPFTALGTPGTAAASCRWPCTASLQLLTCHGNHTEFRTRSVFLRKGRSDRQKCGPHGRRPSLGVFSGPHGPLSLQ